MNKIKILFLLLCLKGIFSFLISEKSSLKTKHHYHRRMNFQHYAKAVFNELNDYRRQKIFQSDIEWKDNLANTAAQEAFEISTEKKKFDDHQSYQQWQKGYKGFTEIIVNYHSQGKVSRPAFASGVLQALIDKYRANLVSQYKYGGVAIYPDQKNYGKYIVVLHLAASGKGIAKNIKDLKKLKPKKSDDLIRTYTSCKDAQQKKEEKNWIKTPDGKTMKCEQKFDGGGWSRVLDSDWLGYHVQGLIPIDDRNIKFTEILFKAKKDFHLSVAAGRANYYDFDGYSFRYNTIKVGGFWYILEASKGYAPYIRYGHKSQMFKKPQDVIKIFEKSNQCFYSTTSEPQNCAKVFKFTKFPPGKLTYFADIESTCDRWYGDNVFKYYFELFVR